MTNKQGLFLQTIYFPIVEYGKQRGNPSLDVWSTGPTYRSSAVRRSPYLDVSSTYDAKNHLLFINVLNRSNDRNLGARIETQDVQIGSAMEVREMNHADLKATHTFGDDKKVRPVTRTFTVDADWRGIYLHVSRALLDDSARAGNACNAVIGGVRGGPLAVGWLGRE